MPIPNFDANGNLPPGIHSAEIDEIETRFGLRGLARKARMNTLKTFLYQIGNIAPEIYIDGSFITAKRAPDDVDIVLLLPSGFDTSSWHGTVIRKYQKARHNLRLHIFSYIDGQDTAQFWGRINFFQTDRDGNRKGIVKLEITQ